MKNYIVKSKNVNNQMRGLVKYTRYLVDNKTTSHQGTDIKVLTGTVKSFVFNAKSEAERKELKNILARKGGKPIKNYAKSLTLNFPKTMKPGEREQNTILHLVLQDIYDFISDDHNTSFNEFQKNILAIAHNQENTHIHLLMPYYINATNVRAYTSKSFLRAVKSSFTIRTDQVMGTDINAYISQDTRQYTKKQVKTDLEQIKKTSQELVELVKLLAEEYPEEADYIEKIERDLEKGHTMKAEKKIKKLINSPQIK